jgi:subtilisin family serine protease
MNRTWLRPAILPVITILLLAGLCCSAWVSPAYTDDERQGLFVPGEVLIKLARASDLPGVAESHRLAPEALDQFGTRPIYRMRILDRVSPQKKSSQLRADPLGRVIYAEPNYTEQIPEGGARVIWAHGGDAGAYVSQWARNLIRLPEAHEISRGAGVTVAVLDTGVDLNHPALVGRLVPGFDFVDMDADPSEEGRYVRNPGFGHGTHVAGLIAMAAPEAKIMPVRVLNENGVGNIWVLAEALAFAVNPDGKPGTDDGADVINLSLGTLRRTDLISDLVTEASRDNRDGDIRDDNDDNEKSNSKLRKHRNVVVIAAAGNRGSTIREFPAAEGAAGLLSVGASTATDKLAIFSNRGEWVNVTAPGEGILSSVPGGGYGTWNGTSMSAPLVAGVAALIRSRYPRLDAVQVVKMIVAASVNIDSPVPYRIDAASPLGRRRRCTPRPGESDSTTSGKCNKSP